MKIYLDARALASEDLKLVISMTLFEVFEPVSRQNLWPSMSRRGVTQKDDHVLLLAKNGSISTFKSSLIIASTHFKKIFDGDERLEQLKLDDVSLEVLLEVLRFVTTGYVKNLERVAVEMLMVAERFQIAALKAKAEKYLEEHIARDNVLNIIEGASAASGLTRLKDTALKYFEAERDAVMASSEWTHISAQLRDVLAAFLN